jgi:hypothetical protein
MTLRELIIRPTSPRTLDHDDAGHLRQSFIGGNESQRLQFALREQQAIKGIVVRQLDLGQGYRVSNRNI